MLLESLPWYYQSDLQDESTLSGEEWHHARNVKRLQTGHEVILFNGKGMAIRAKLIASERSEGRFASIENISESFTQPHRNLVRLGFALTKNPDRNSFALEKATELGVDEIILLNCDHSERIPGQTDRYEKIIVSAGKQSRKIVLPYLSGPSDPVFVCKESLASQPNCQIVCCHLGEVFHPLEKKYQTGRDVLLLIGPEGGFSEKEVDAFKQLHIPFVTLGPYRLRTETAAIAAIQTIHTLNHLHPHT